MTNNQTGFIQLIVIVVLLVGIGVAVYLTQFTQVFKPKAAETPLTKITDENYETTINPWGDPWAWKKNPNPNIPIALAAPTQYWKSSDSNGTILERQAQFIAKSNAPFLYFDSYEPHAEGQNPKSIALINRIKQLNPNIKALGYFVQWEPGPGYDEVLQGANNGNSTYESFFVHKKDKPANKDNRLYGRPDHPEWGFSPLMDITNPNYRAYIIPKIVENIRSAKMDGLMNDLLFYNYTDYYNNPPSSMPDNYMPDSIKFAWPGGMVAFIQELKAAMGPDMYLYGNVNDDQPQFMQNDLLASGRLDGVIFEDPFNSRPDPNAISKVTNLMNIVDSFGKKSIMVVSGAHNGTPHTSSSEAQEKSAERYFLTAYLMTLRSANHMLLYYHPTSILFQYNSEAFFKEWDLSIGGATSGPQNVGNGVYLREFERAYVYWNPTSSNYTIPDGRELYSIDNGQEIRGQVVPANSGGIFVTSSLLAEYNTPPTPVAPPLVSPSPSPQLTAPNFTANTVAYCNGSVTRVHLEWSQTEGATAYKIFRRLLGSTTANQIVEVSPNVGYNDDTVISGSQYNYYIQAIVGSTVVTGAGQDMTEIPNCSTSVSPSPVNTPSPRKIGDIDNNGKVDIFDFNIFVGDYPLKNLRSDLNNDQKVDIFDFNLIVSNFRRIGN